MLDIIENWWLAIIILLFLASVLRGVHHNEKQSVFDKNRCAKYVYLCGFLYVLGVGVVSALASNQGVG